MSLDTKFAQFSRPKSSEPTSVTAIPTGGLSAADAGLLAVNFAGHTAAEKLDNKVAIYSWDGGSWIHLNSVAAISTQTIDLTAGTAGDIGAEYAVSSPALTGDVIVATYGSPAGAYLLTNKAAPGTASSWTSLGSATAFADGAAMSAATPNALSAVTPEGFRVELARTLGITSADLLAGAAGINTGGGLAGAAGKFALLNAVGKFDASFLSIQGLNFRAGNLTVAVPVITGGFKNGDVYVANAVGAPDATWNFPTVVTHVEIGDMALYDGAEWHHLATATDLTIAMLKTHTNTMTKDGKLVWEATGAVADAVLIDGNNAANAVMQNFKLKSCVISGGTF